MPKKPSSPPPIDLLVVGDWVVDDHWVVGEHQSVSSSRTGMLHSRALADYDCSVRSLCGAGQVATILHQARFEPPVALRVSGLGLWHPNDGTQLALMLDPLNDVGGPTGHGHPIERSVGVADQ